MRLIPFRHDCSEILNHYKTSVQCFREALFALEPVRIEFGYVRYLRPFGLNLLSAMTFELLRNGLQVSLTPPQDERVNIFLADQGFYSEFLIGDAGRLQSSPRSTSVGLRRLDEPDGNYLTSVAHWLKRHSDIPFEDIEDMVMVTMPEVINNVFDHSRSPFGCYVCAVAYPSEQRLMLSVIDFGVGFYASLSPHYRDIHNDSDAIALAVKPGISSKPKKGNAGRGLHILSDWVKTTHGELEIVSQDGHWIQDSQGVTTTNNISFTFPGSCINLCVRTSHLPSTDPTERRRYD